MAGLLVKKMEGVVGSHPPWPLRVAHDPQGVAGPPMGVDQPPLFFFFFFKIVYFIFFINFVFKRNNGIL